jgi:hypothetical protein
MKNVVASIREFTGLIGEAEGLAQPNVVLPIPLMMRIVGITRNC